MRHGEVVKVKITRDITKLVFDQIRIDCIKKEREREYRTSCKTVLTTLTKPTRKHTHTHTHTHTKKKNKTKKKH